MALNMAHKQKL